MDFFLRRPSHRLRSRPSLDQPGQVHDYTGQTQSYQGHVQAIQAMSKLSRPSLSISRPAPRIFGHLFSPMIHNNARCHIMSRLIRYRLIDWLRNVRLTSRLAMPVLNEICLPTLRTTDHTASQAAHQGHPFCVTKTGTSKPRPRPRPRRSTAPNGPPPARSSAHPARSPAPPSPTRAGPGA